MVRIIQWKETQVAVRNTTDEGQPQEGECDSSYAFVYAGHGTTDTHGRWITNLKTINCLPPGPAHNSLPSIVATPTFSGLLTVMPQAVILVARATPGGGIEVHSFDHNGQVKGNVPFSWHCVVEGELVV
ncbi:MAG: hypothetical protein QOH21_3273 [Acidobacteriota bacterium]|jgi:hypothetical protein|nr:hypothetical protein [Acidobacteriota bacterium]